MPLMIMPHKFYTNTHTDTLTTPTLRATPAVAAAAEWSL